MFSTPEEHGRLAIRELPCCLMRPVGSPHEFKRLHKNNGWQILPLFAIRAIFKFGVGQSTGVLKMSTSINLSLTDELRAFVNENSGDGTLYATPSEYMRDLLRQQKRRQEAAAARDAILEGYQDAIEGRTHAYEGDLKSLLKQAK